MEFVQTFFDPPIPPKVWIQKLKMILSLTRFSNVDPTETCFFAAYMVPLVFITHL